MQEAIKQRGDRSGVAQDLAPVIDGAPSADLVRSCAPSADLFGSPRPPRDTGVPPPERITEGRSRLRLLKSAPSDLALRIRVSVQPVGVVMHDRHPYSMPPDAIGLRARCISVGIACALSLVAQRRARAHHPGDGALRIKFERGLAEQAVGAEYIAHYPGTPTAASPFDDEDRPSPITAYAAPGGAERTGASGRGRARQHPLGMSEADHAASDGLDGLFKRLSLASARRVGRNLGAVERDFERPSSTSSPLANAPFAGGHRRKIEHTAAPCQGHSS